jgi:hypothetical protein
MDWGFALRYLLLLTGVVLGLYVFTRKGESPRKC